MVLTKDKAGNDFFSVVTEAIKDLRAGRTAYAFCQDHVDTILDLIDKKNISFSSKDISVREEDGFFYLTNTKKGK